MANVCKQIFQPQRNQYYILHTTYLKQFCFVLNSQHVVEPWNKNVISFRGDSLTICHPSMKVAWDPWNHFILQLDNEFCQTTVQILQCKVPSRTNPHGHSNTYIQSLLASSYALGKTRDSTWLIKHMEFLK